MAANYLTLFPLRYGVRAPLPLTLGGRVTSLTIRVWQKGLYVPRLGHESLQFLPLLKYLLPLKAQSQDAPCRKTAVIL